VIATRLDVCVMATQFLCDTDYISVTLTICVCVMGWLWFVGSIKL